MQTDKGKATVFWINRLSYMKCKRCDRIGVSDVKRFTGGCQNKYGLSVDERVLGSLYFFFLNAIKVSPFLGNYV
jgi:hypothetical protein